MRISLTWVRRLLGLERLPVDGAELARLVTMHLAEIDAVERVGPCLDGVVVGRVCTCEPHPDADRLRVTTVDIGQDEPVQVVCGAPNVAAGQHVAVATVGTTLQMRDAEGNERPLVIKKGRLRGQDSHGMICAEDELGLGERHDGILVLDGSPRPGTPLAEVLASGDTVLVVDNHNINHRPDLWGHLGWAREIAAILDLPAPQEPDISWPSATSAPMAVEIRSPGCPAYSGAVVSGVSNGPSPAWMQDLLTAAGMRPRGLLVDITNYVMLELGEPMHAFDRRAISGECLVVREAAPGETFTTLDQTTCTLDDGDLVIADQHLALALAGIMGGENSMVADDTDTVVLEAATFIQARIRRTRIRTGLASESSTRFEKGLYPLLTRAAINRALALLAECCPGCRVLGHFAAGDGLAQAADQDRVIPYHGADLTRLTGLSLPDDRQAALLARLGCRLAPGGFTRPWWRAKDLNHAADLVEEVARLHGYDHIAPAIPLLPAAVPAANPLRRAEHRSRAALSALGWDEVATYGFISEAWAEALATDAQRPIRLVHPLSSQETVLRLDLLANLAQAATANLRHAEAVRIYEIGKIYGGGLGSGTTPDERLQVAGLIADRHDETPFYAAREAAQALLEGLGHSPTIEPADDPRLAPGRRARLMVAGRAVGVVGELALALRQRAGCPCPAALFTIELEHLVADLPPPPPPIFTAPSRYPSVDRDFTFVCPEDLPFGVLADGISAAARPWVRGVGLAAPVYRGDQIPPGHKALSLRVILQADDRTLDEKTLRKTCQRIISTIEAKTPARLRG